MRPGGKHVCSPCKHPRGEATQSIARQTYPVALSMFQVLQADSTEQPRLAEPARAQAHAEIAREDAEGSF